MRTKSKRRFLPIVCLLVVSALFGTIGAYTGAKAYTPEGVEASTDTVTGYYMTVSLNGLETYLSKADRYGQAAKAAGVKYWTRTSVTAAIIITYPEVVYDGMAVFVSGNARVSCPARGWASEKVVFESDVRINIRESFYNYFQLPSVNYGKCQLTVLLGNEGFGLSSGGFHSVENYVFTPQVTFETKELPPDVNDPNSPNFELGDNGGTNPNPLPTESKSLLQVLYDFLSKIFGWNLSFKTFRILFWCIVGVIGLALFMTLMRAIFGHR